MNINEELSKSLSGLDILQNLNFRPNLITYSDIHTFDNLDQLLGKNKSCVLLYLTKKNYGHWCCVYENDKGHIIFFDSYGFIPDDQLNFIPKQLRKELNQEHRILTQMLYDSKKPIEYNDYKLQAEKPNIATCGRWVSVRLQYKNIPVDEFANLFLDVKHKMSPDVVVCFLTK